MSLIKCSECGNNISTKALECPNCGSPVSLDSEIHKDLIKTKEYKLKTEYKTMIEYDAVKEKVILPWEKLIY